MSHGFQGFQDYTQSSALERFVDGLERAIKELASSSTDGRGTPRSVSVTHALPFRRDAYTLTWIPCVGNPSSRSGRSGLSGRSSQSSQPDGPTVVDMVSHEVKYHDWFLPEDCIVLEPESYSRRILTSEEYHTVLSAVALALDSLDSLVGGGELAAATLPAVYIPRHDARRDACGGVRKVAVVGNRNDDAGDDRRRQTRTQWFDCDSVHGRVGEASMWMSDLGRRLDMFAGRLEGAGRDRVRRAAEAVRDCEAAGEPGIGPGIGPGTGPGLEREGVVCSSKRTYHVYRKEFVADGAGCPRDAHDVDQTQGQRQREWDAGMAWAPWVAQDDPVGGIEVDVIVNDALEDTRLALASGDCADSTASSSSPFADAVLEAERNHVRRAYRIYAMDAEHAADTGNRSFLPLQVADVSRKFLRCVDVESLDREAVCAFPVRPGVQSGRDGFAARLHACLRWYRIFLEHEHEREREGEDQRVDRNNADTDADADADADGRGALTIEDVLGESWWVARADELGVDVEPPVAEEDVQHIIQNVVASQEAWDARGVPLIDVAALHATTIPDALRGVMQVWKAFADSEALPTMGPREAMGRMIAGLFRSACAILRQSQSERVRRQVEALRCHSDPVLRDLVDRASAAAKSSGADVSPVYGVSNVLGCIEHTAAAAASLYQRLEGLDARVAQTIVEGMLSNATIDSPNVGCPLADEDVGDLARADRDKGGPVGLDGPVSIEHVIEVSDVTASGRGTVTGGAPRHRMYVNRLPNEVRVATSVTDG